MAGSRSACPSGRPANAPRCRPLSWWSLAGSWAFDGHALPCDAAWPRSEAWQPGGVPGPSDTGSLVGVGVARGGAEVGFGVPGLAGLCTTAIGPEVAAAVGCVTTGLVGIGDGCAEGTGDGATDGAGVPPSPGSSLGPGPAGVGFTAGALAAGVGAAVAGAVGVVVSNAVPEVGTAPMPGVGAGADNPYPNATVASTRLTMPRARTRRRRLPQSYSWPASDGLLATMVAPVRRRPATRAIQPSIAISIGS
jgi:hypothetical protein